MMMMPVFAYKALETDTKRVVEGNIEAIDLRHAKQLLRNQGKMVQKLDKIQQRRGNTASFGLTSANGAGAIGSLKVLLGQQPSLKHVYMFTQQMGTLLGSGIPLVETLYLIEQQTVHVGFRQMLQQIRADVINGYTFSAALIRCKGTFSRLFIAMVKAGEQTGDLSRVFMRLEQLIKTQIGLRNKITGALIMPAMTLLVISAVLVIMLIFVVPQFEQMFDSRGADLPFITITLLMASKTLQNFWWLILIALFVAGAWFNVFRQGVGKPLVDSTLLRIPLLGDFLKKVYANQFTATLANLLGSGIIITEAFKTAAATVTNHEMTVAFEAAQESLMLGSSASRPLEESNVFPMLVTKMLAIGEQTGEMEVMLNKAAQFLESEIDIGITLLTEMVQPLITIVLGVLLLYVVLAIYLPIFALNKVVAG
jgi:type II secretory pathway component PulF